MIRSLIRPLATLGGALVAILAAPPMALAQTDNYPNRPISIIVPLAPGGVADTVIRPVAQKVAEQMNASIIVENRPGGGGNVASIAAKQAAPDGYTLFLTNNGPFAVNPHLFPKLGFDPVKDFKPITTVVTFPSVLAVPASSPAKTTADLIEMAKAKSKSGGITYGSQGLGSGGHINAEMFGLAIGAPLVHIPYKGSGQAVGDLAAGRFDFIFAGYLSVQGLTEDKRVRLLGITSPKRSPSLPDLPTLTEQGYPEVELDVWHALVAPAGTPDAIVKRLNAEFVKALQDPKIKELINSRAAVVGADSPEELGQRIASDLKRMGQVVRDAKISVQQK